MNRFLYAKLYLIVCLIFATYGISKAQKPSLAIDRYLLHPQASKSSPYYSFITKVGDKLYFFVYNTIFIHDTNL